MTNPQISIIIPVYNTERFLPHCIESILAQTYKNFELILINDGSSDNSGAICDLYANQDNRIRVIHKKNAGVSEARNTGIKKANGTWITFIDADDYINTNYLQSFENYLDNISCISIHKGMYLEYINSNRRDFAGISATITGTISDYYSAEISGIIDSPCFKLFSLQIIKKYSLKFDKHLSYGEDLLFNQKYLLVPDITHINIIDYVGYHYIKEENSSSLTNRYHTCSNRLEYAEVTYNNRLQILKKFQYNNSKLTQFFKSQLKIKLIESDIALYSPYASENKKQKRFLHHYIVNKIKTLLGVKINCYQKIGFILEYLPSHVSACILHFFLPK